MTLVAAAAVGSFVFLLAGVALGRPVVPGPWLRARGRSTSLRRWLAQCGVSLTSGQFVVGSLAVGLVAFVVGVLITRTALVAIVPALAVGCAPAAYFARARAVRRRAVQAAWPDGLRDIAASVGSGRSLAQALVQVSETGPEALRAAFADFPALARMIGTTEALMVVEEQLADPTSDRVIEVLVLAHERGGRIVTQILEDLVVATSRDLKVLDEIESEGLEMKINAGAVVVMPWLVLVMLTIRGGAFREFYGSRAGLVVVVVGGALSALGYFWIRRLGRGHDEERVFGAARPGGAAS